MKNNIIVNIIIATLFFSSCEDFDEMNRDPVLMDSVTPGVLINPILYRIAAFNWSRSYSFTFELMQVTVPTNSTKGISNYDVSTSEGDNSWTTYYTLLNNVKEMEKLSVKVNDPNYQAISLTLKSWISQLIVDAFGDAPISEACRGDEMIFSPKFDAQMTIYEGIINDLLLANGLYDEKKGLKYNSGSMAEILYGTNNTLNTENKSPGIIKWKKFSNSLLMRVLLRIQHTAVNRNISLETMLANPVTFPVFADNSDEALLAISGVFPLSTPMARISDYGNYRTASTFILDSAMGRWFDNRRGVFYKTTVTPAGNKYAGYPSGYDIVPNLGFSPSKLNATAATAPLKIVLLPFAEIEFIKAEYELKNGTFEKAETAYVAGITASHTQWGVTIATSAGGMMNNAAVRLNKNDDINKNLQKIMLQKYLALIFCDYQQWFEHSRTGLPGLPRGTGIPTGYNMPKRLLYPANVQRTNMENYQEALSRMGPDAFSTKLFWQQ